MLDFPYCRELFCTGVQAVLTLGKPVYSIYEFQSKDKEKAAKMAFVPQYHMPATYKGQRIGLFGGSFDPAHMGHVHMTLNAMKRFNLTHVWWLISPANPLKPFKPTALCDRIAQARNIMQHPRVTVTALENQLQTRFTADTITQIQSRKPHAKFIWLMGADNMVQFSDWKDWENIAHMLPMGILARPKFGLAAQRSKAAQILRHARLPQHQSHLLPYMPAPSWCFCPMPLRGESSTNLRRAVKPV